MKTIVAFGLLACALVAALVVACSDNAPSCKDGEFQLQVNLEGTAIDADTITITGTDPGAMVSMTVPHTPGLVQQIIDVNFSGGYPADKLVHLLVKATGGVTNLGEIEVDIHTDPKCSVATAVVRSQAADMANSD